MHPQSLVHVLLATFITRSFALLHKLPSDDFSGRKRGSYDKGMLHHTVYDAKNSLNSSLTGAADVECTHGPLSRNCWSGGYSISTDVDDNWPNTGRTVSVSVNPSYGLSRSEISGCVKVHPRDHKHNLQPRWTWQPVVSPSKRPISWANSFCKLVNTSFPVLT